MVRHRRRGFPVHRRARRPRDELHGLAPRAPLDAAAHARNGTHRARSAARHRLRLTHRAAPVRLGRLCGPPDSAERPARQGACPPSNFKDCYTFGQFRLPAGNLCLSASIVRISRTHSTP
ncbi:hypothetical protein F01_500138 [Burkholderia cenocepacia]|nr:hypothetical protein F01_500138 [Burkholderia cenocepacia]